ncbi:succinate dehydrogenase assembly factor 1 mitochondrial [Prunus yedoensis var. nudiflora]|uniref:Succinate dehydrogenase assembly factor 1 mitochondrial n=1 Tax=Prunus yedoensis var. nudiflora TaxID=2094558 RepID=A0A314YY75_PRUYE|nr:succinate dehydrogenase assembly factor 1 mitochondrial [Prunus yedoensis var. nudiflora]
MGFEEVEEMGVVALGSVGFGIGESTGFGFLGQIWCQTKEEAMGASSPPRLSGMQKQVLSLYRGFLRAARAKSAEDRQQIESLVSN